MIGFRFVNLSGKQCSAVAVMSDELCSVHITTLQPFQRQHHRCVVLRHALSEHVGMPLTREDCEEKIFPSSLEALDKTT